MTDIERRMNEKELIERTLRDLQGFALWSPTAMTQLLSYCRLGWHTRGSVLSAKVQADAPEIFVIVSGHVVQTEASLEHGRLSWALRGPGHILGFAYMLNIAGRVLEYVANDDVVAVHMPARLVFELLDSDPVRWKHIGRMLMHQERAQIDMVIGQIVGTFAQRLASTIEQLAALYGVRTTQTGATHLRLTQQDLADILRVSRQSVSKELSKWATSGAIRLQYNAVVILDPTALKRISKTLAPQDDGVTA
jgi:CRP-like cAMP-binding protein